MVSDEEANQIRRKLDEGWPLAAWVHHGDARPAGNRFAVIRKLNPDSPNIDGRITAARAALGQGDSVLGEVVERLTYRQGEVIGDE